MFSGPFNESMVKLAQEKGKLDLYIHNLRKWTSDKRKTVDDNPYGGGPGMIMKVEPFYKATKELRSKLKTKKGHVILTSAKGELFSQTKAIEYSEKNALIILCGHYEGVDERVARFIADEEISIGRYILTGGELPAMVITDAVTRLLPGVLGNKDSIIVESFTNDKESEYPQYTRPEVFTSDEGTPWKVPEVLLGGNHKKIEEWRKKN